MTTVTRELRISPDLVLPLEAVTDTFGILAKRGVGKTYTASVLAEELLVGPILPRFLQAPNLHGEAQRRLLDARDRAAHRPRVGFLAQRPVRAMAGVRRRSARR